MSWIEEVEVSEADGNLAEIYAQLEKQRGKVSNILNLYICCSDSYKYFAYS